MAAPAMETYATTNFNLNSWVATAPAGTANGDVLLAVLFNSSGRTVSSEPSGWTLLGSKLASPNVYVYAKDAGGSEPSDYTWGWSGIAGGIAAIVRISGAATIAGNAPEVDCDGAAGSSGSCVADAVTPSDADSLVARFCCTFGGESGHDTTKPASETQFVDATGDYGATGISYFTHGTTSTGTGTWTYTPTWRAAQAGTIAFAPAAVVASSNHRVIGGGWGGRIISG
jgi:hypothetical protein